MSTVLYPPLICSQVRAGIDEAIALARRLDRAAIFTHVAALPFIPDPIAFLGAGSREIGSGILWAQPSLGFALAGAGAGVVLRANGSSRFRDISGQIADARQRLVVSGAPAPLPFIGGFAFAPGGAQQRRWAGFPDAQLVVPSLLLQSEGDAAFMRATVEVGPSSDPERTEHEVNTLLERGQRWVRMAVAPERNIGPAVFESIPRQDEWQAAVAAAMEEIRRGCLDKVVLARETRLYAGEAFSAIAALQHLRESQPAATHLAMQSRGDWFIGATPERLVKVRDGQVDVTCLAGSIATGKSDGESQALGQELLASAKDRLEHELVVRGTLEALAGSVLEPTRRAGNPRVVAARSVQHLETAISARVAPGTGIVDLVERLHPTPAVGGYPRDHALEAIARLEVIERGWYAGPFGWAGLDGSGEFAVAIRSGLLSGRTASVFAGAGIVAGSAPKAELAETELKLRPMLAALGAE